ncbi:MAG: DEAD/DEAH box helicase family protein, partial [Gemmatimonadetes bacterium]|nr:DEAD/DEAH box helicase family protein [Gemmatimonadota bacterium]
MSVVDDLVRDMQLWLPQREALAALHAILSNSPIGRGISKKKTLSEMMVAEPGAPYAWQKTFNFPEEMNPQVGTEFPSFCFAIATGGGKTRLMGACIAYLYETKGFRNFFILSKGQTIYNKHRVEDFDPASAKYVFKGLPGFPRPRLIDGDNYERSAYPELFSDDLTLYLFNIEKIFNERTDVEFRFHRFHEGIGGSFADVLRGKPDLVFLMDESHNIRAEQSLKAINALKPILGLEFTATPKKGVSNVVYTFPLRRATREGGPNGGGLVKRARIVARRDDDSLTEEREDIKLRDGIAVHEKKKVALETYCRNDGLALVKPRVLICAPPSKQDQEKKEIERIAEYIQSDGFLGGAYRGKVLAVHQGSDDEQIQKLLDLEKKPNDIEIVLHVNKLKEGWDVQTVYTIIPLRAAVSEILRIQTIGRGLRLPFGRQVSRDPGLSQAEREE